MRRLLLNRKFNDGEWKICFSESINGKPYLAVDSPDNTLGIPLTENNAKKMFFWLKKYLEKSGVEL